MNKDHRYMTHALNLARTGLGRTGANPSVGCVIVRHGRVIAAARTGDGGRPHAEFLALAAAGEEARGATVYVSLEPCAHEGETPSCARLLAEAGVKRVVVACGDPDPRTFGEGLNILHSAKFSGGVEVLSGEVQREAEALNRGFFLRVSENRPFVTCKIACSADGKIAAVAGERTAITGELAQRYTHVERSQHDAILVGIETVLVDDPLLTTRFEGVEDRAIRVVLDSDLRISAGSQLVQTAGEFPLFIFHNSTPQKEAAFVAELSGMGGVVLVRVDTRDIQAVLGVLAAQGINRVLVEGGAAVHGSFLESGFVDRFLHFRAPHEIGAQGVPFDVDGLEKNYGLTHKETRVLGADVLEEYARCSPG